MKNKEIIRESISLVDEILKTKARKNIIGTLITGTGLTVTALGISVLLNKPENIVSESEQYKDKIE